MRGIGEEQWRGGTLAEMLCRFGVECAMAATLRRLNFYVFIFNTCVVSTLILLPLSIIFGRYLTPAFTFTLSRYLQATPHSLSFLGWLSGMLITSKNADAIGSFHH
ncbi:unnamed protein product [Brassica rapa subsp. trilocularis]